ncbi:hypothetical protein GQ42DRAFT_168538, partial [Ramicandelaber brevisporus]
MRGHRDRNVTDAAASHLMLPFRKDARGSTVNAGWIRGHSGHRGNEAADALATVALNSETATQMTLDAPQPGTHPYRVCRGFRFVPARVFKLGGNISRHAIRTELLLTLKSVPEMAEVTKDNVAFLLRVINHGRGCGRRHGSQVDPRFKAASIKWLLKLPPTFAILHERKPAEYAAPASACPRCRENVREDFAHLLVC